MKTFLKSLKFKVILTYLSLISISLVLIFVISSNFITDILIRKEIEEISREGTGTINNLVPFFESKDEFGYEKAKEIIKLSGIRTGFRYLVTDPWGRVLFDSHDRLKSKDITKIKEIKSSQKGFSSSNIYKFEDGSELVYYSSPIYIKNTVEGIIFISKSTDTMINDLRYFRNSYIILSLGLLIFVFIISFLFTDLISKPIFKMNRQIKNTTSTGKIEEIEKGDDDELSQLALSINSLLKQIKVLDKIRKGFVSDVSHELKTPITSLKIISDTLVNKPAENIDVYKDFMIDINEEMDHLNSIIDNLISLANIEKDEFNLKVETFDIKSVINHRLDNLRELARQKNIKINSENLPSIFVSADKTKIKQLIDNIVNNAIKYTDSGGEISVKMNRRKSDLELSISDNGIGISEKDIPYIFDRFYMAETGKKRTKKSSGIGLSICKEIVTLHSGELNVKSKLHEGSTFFIKMPILKEKELL